VSRGCGARTGIRWRAEAFQGWWRCVDGLRAAIVAVSDELHGDQWNIGFGGDAMVRGMTRLHASR
jgi:hypothetical protein